MSDKIQRSRLRLLAGAGLLLAAPQLRAAPARTVLRVGDGRGMMRAMLEGAGVLDKLPYTLEWADFPAAAPLLEALAANSIDVGGTGDAPLLFAVAAGARVKAVRATQTDPSSIAIIARGNSPLTDAASLHGKRIAVTRGSIGHYLVVAALHRASIRLDEVTLVYLLPADAKAAFSSGAVDAWSIWNPYLLIALTRENAKVVAHGGNGLWPGLGYLAAHEKAIQTKTEAIADFLRRSQRAQDWALQNADAYAAMQSRLTGLPVDVLKQMYEATRPRGIPIDDRVIAGQQQIADTYLAAGVIKQPINVRPSFDTRFSTVN